MSPPATATPPPIRVGRRVLYLSNVMPIDDSASGIIVQRHLAELVRQGWDVTVVDLPQLHSGPVAWHSVPLPVRQWWWPPFRPDRTGVAALGSIIWRHALRRAGVARADLVVTICWGPLSWLAAEIARADRCPLVVIVHDHWTERPSDAAAHRAFQHSCRQAGKILAVSPEMQAQLTSTFGPKVDVLYPVPAARPSPFATWRAEHARRPRVAHAGTLLPFHADYLAALAAVLATAGGELLVVCPAANATLSVLRQRCPNLVHHDYFPDHRDALHWIAREASAVTVMHARRSDGTGRPPTGFPSRLLELAQLGLPMLLAAPAANPLAGWARRRSWTALTEPGDVSALTTIVRGLTAETTWSALAAETRLAAEGEFNPARIHAQFAAVLSDASTAAAGPAGPIRT